MDTTSDFHDFVLNDLFAPFDGITARRMFGGFGYYLNGHIFAFTTSDGQLYFKVDEASKADYRKLGSEPFEYARSTTNQTTKMPYWLLPEQIMEDNEKLWKWIQRSAAVSKAQKKK